MECHSPTGVDGYGQQTTPIHPIDLPFLDLASECPKRLMTLNLTPLNHTERIIPSDVASDVVVEVAAPVQAA